MTKQDALIDWLTKLKEFGEQSRAARDGWRHHSYEGFVLEYGRLWTPQRRPPPYTAKRVYKQCFKNATNLADTTQDFDEADRLTYVEGYAWGGTISVLHAWCVDSQGRVIDPTWKQADCATAAYVGIPYNWDWLVHHTVTTGCYGVLGGSYHTAVELLRTGLPADAYDRERWYA